MFLRKVRSSELLECLSVGPGHTGSELIGNAKAIAVWRRLFRSPAFNCVAIETESRIDARQIVGFGSSVFVSSKFVDNELANPRPGLNARIMESVDSGKPVVLNESELRAGNTYGGLDLVVLCGCWRNDLTSSEQVSEAQMLLASSFLQDHVGYRLKRILSEIIGLTERQFVKASHVWQEVVDFGNSKIADQPSRSLWLVTKNSGLAVPGSIITMLFHFREPVLRLPPSNQQLLLAALDGATDQELSQRLGLNLGTIKKRWISLFNRVADIQPYLLPEANPENNGDRRGPQKRHRVLAYIREHPEELRSFEIRPACKPKIRSGSRAQSLKVIH